MNDSRTTINRSDDDVLRAAATEIHREAPAPQPWESLAANSVRRNGPRSTSTRRGLLAVAAVSLLVAGVAGTVLVIDRQAPTSVPSASDQLPPVRPAGQPWTPVIEQPELSTDIDAIPVSGDAADWAGRALFPTETPDGFTVESVSQGLGGAMTESGGVDTGDVSAEFITTTPTGSFDDPRIVIETVPAGIGGLESDGGPEIVVTGEGAEWDVYVDEGPDGVYYATAYVRTDGPGGMVMINGTDSAPEAKAEIESFLASLRLVRVEEIPTEVIDLNRLPVVATVASGDAAAGFIRAMRTTNAWCLVTRIGNGGVTGCGFRIDPETTPAVFVDLSYSDENIVTVAGMAAPGVTAIEVDLADGSVIAVQPNFSDDVADGIGFWAAAHLHDGPIPSDGPVVATRVFGIDGTVIGAVEGP